MNMSQDKYYLWIFKNVSYRMMKTIPFILLIVLISSSCSKWIDPDINTNPNNPADIPMEVLLPFLEADIAYKMCGSPEVILVQSIWLQQMDGIDRQSLAFANYSYDPMMSINPWDGAYAEMLMDAKILKEKADAAGSSYNAAVAKILTTIVLGQLTDSWNSIPWSEAFQGSQVTQPKFDNQEFIYSEIQRLLDEAINLLSVDFDPVGIKGDYFYDGDPVKWEKLAYALKARYTLHLSRRLGDIVFEEVLDLFPMAFSSNEDDLQFNYGTGASESNPLYQYMMDRDDARMGAYFIDLLIENEDPRLEVFAWPDGEGNYVGSAPGQTNVNASRPGPAVANPDAPIYLITYVEVLFMKVEALFKTGTSEEEVRIALVEAVSTSLEKYNVWDEDWLGGYSQEVQQLTGEALFEEIMTQKYFATYYQPEAYHSWRRTGYPVIPPNPIGQTPDIPRRFPYPATEVANNPNTPNGITLMDRVWWDE
jgi:hypothetical protein